MYSRPPFCRMHSVRHFVANTAIVNCYRIFMIIFNRSLQDSIFNTRIIYVIHSNCVTIIYVYKAHMYFYSDYRQSLFYVSLYAWRYFYSLPRFSYDSFCIYELEILTSVKFNFFIISFDITYLWYGNFLSNA